MDNLVNDAIENLIVKEVMKLIDIKGLAKKVAVQMTKDINKTIKKGGFFNEKHFAEALEDHIDYYKIARAASKGVNDKMLKLAKKS